MSETEAAAPAVELVVMNRDPELFPTSHKADVHPNEVQGYLAAGWTFGEPRDPNDNTFWPRDRLLVAVREQFDTHLQTLTDDQLRDLHSFSLFSADKDDEDEDQLDLQFSPAADAAASPALLGDGAGEPLPELTEDLVTEEREAPAADPMTPVEEAPAAAEPVVEAAEALTHGEPAIGAPDVALGEAGDEPAELGASTVIGGAGDDVVEEPTAQPAPGDRDGDGLAREDMTSAQLREAITLAEGVYLARDDKETLQRKLAEALAAKAAKAAKESEG